MKEKGADLQVFHLSRLRFMGYGRRALYPMIPSRLACLATGGDVMISWERAFFMTEFVVVLLSRGFRRAAAIGKLGVGVLLLGLTASPSAMADEEITQYRLRAFEGTTPPDWVSPYVPSATVLPTLIKQERGTPLDAFQEFWYFAFDGTNRYVCTDTVAANDLSADFSVSAWIRPDSLTGTQTICSTIDAAAKAGFRLSLKSGKVVGEAWFTENSAKKLYSVTYGSSLRVGNWYHIVFRRIKDTAAVLHAMDLWVDSMSVGITRIPLASEIDNSSLDPIFGAERGSPGYQDYLRASVHGIQVDDYALSTFFLESIRIRDGSRYFGQPSYHDYIGEGSASRPLERRIMDTYEDSNLASFSARLIDRMMLPFANDDYIPQGICADQEGRRFFVSFYYKGIDEDSVGKYPSIVAEIDAQTGKLGNTFILSEPLGAPVTAHSGGIVYVDGAIIIPDGTRLLVYDVGSRPPSAFDPATLTGFNPVVIRATQIITKANDTGLDLVPWNSIAFLDFFRDDNHVGWLLLGDYDSAVSTVRIFRMDSLLSPPQFKLSQQRILRQFTDNMQGSAGYFMADGVLRMFQAGTGQASPGITASRILDALYSSYLTLDTPQIGGSTLLVPRGLEQLSLFDGKLWTLSESGSRHIQKRSSSPWKECFPFLYSVDVRSQLDRNLNGMLDQWEASRNLPAGTNPNADSDKDGLTTYEEYLADTSPLDGFHFPRLSLSPNVPRVTFLSSVLRFYTLETSKDLKNWEVVPSLVHRRGRDSTMSISLPNKNDSFYRLRIEEY